MLEQKFELHKITIKLKNDTYRKFLKIDIKLTKGHKNSKIRFVKPNGC